MDSNFINLTEAFEELVQERGQTNIDKDAFLELIIKEIEKQAEFN